MKPTQCLMATLCLVASLVLAAPVPAAQPPLCIGDGPESVLRCYADVYAGRDSLSYAALLAPDYVSTDLSYPDQAKMDYRACLQLTGRMFRAPNIQSLALEFGEPARIDPGEAPGSWVVRDVPCTLRMLGMSDAGRPGPWVVKKVVSLWVRTAPEPRPHFLVFREEHRDPDEK